MSAIKEYKRYTYTDYAQWDDDERWELIDGVPYNMSPAPSLRHQRLSGWLFTKISNTLEGKKCIPLDAPTDVVFSDYDVVQPDILVVCDHEKITEKNIQGAPDLIIEVISPSTNRHDRWDKKRLYQKYGVKEYIVVDMEGEYSEQYLLGEEDYFQDAIIVNFDEQLKLATVDNLPLTLQDALDIPPFNQEKPKET